MPKKIPLNPRIVRVDGRKGEPKEYVEFVIEDAHRAFGMQKSGPWWIVFNSDTRPNGPVETFASYPLYRRSEAVKAAREAAEAFCARPAS